MLLDQAKLPRGIRNNNPGNLRSACAPTSKTHRNDGYACFDTAEEGLLNLAWCIWDFYAVHKLNTVPAFINRYAPVGENIPLDYETFLAKWLGINARDASHQDMNLYNIANAADLMKGIIRFECGIPPRTWSNPREWFSYKQCLTAISGTGKWNA